MARQDTELFLPHQVAVVVKAEKPWGAEERVNQFALWFEASRKYEAKGNVTAIAMSTPSSENADHEVFARTT